MSEYIHEFKVRMWVDTKSKKVATNWINARLHGGDAGFVVEHTGKVEKGRGPSHGYAARESSFASIIRTDEKESEPGGDSE